MVVPAAVITGGGAAASAGEVPASAAAATASSAWLLLLAPSGTPLKAGVARFVVVVCAAAFEIAVFLRVGGAEAAPPCAALLPDFEADAFGGVVGRVFGGAAGRLGETDAVGVVKEAGFGWAPCCDEERRREERKGGEGEEG